MSPSRLKFAWLAAACAIIPTTAWAQSAPPSTSNDDQAQSEGADSGQFGDIIVTAQRRSQNLQDVPIAITALSGDELERRGVRNALDLTAAVPGLQINNLFQSSTPTIFLRGVGVNDFNTASAGAVGVTVDDIFLNSGVGQLFALFDLDRVEVLKGPQGTLYGRNTTGGVINYQTRRPTFDTQANASLTYGRFNQIFFDGGIGGAIVGDTLAGRASISIRQRDGYGVNTIDGRDINGIDTVAGRVQLLWTPNDRLEIQNKVEGGRVKTSALGHQSLGIFNAEAGRPCTGEEILQRTTCINPITGWRADEDIDTYTTDVLDNSEQLDNFADRLQVTWDGDAVRITSITGYVWNKRRLSQDQDFSPFAILSSPIWTERSRQFSQELQVGSTGDGPVNWVAGAYYLRENLSSLVNFSLLREFNPTPTQPFFDPASSILLAEREFTQITESKAVFAQADIDLTDKLTATAGFRYTDDRKDLNFRVVAGAVNGSNNVSARLATPLIGLIDSNNADFGVDGFIDTRVNLRKPTWRLALAYEFNPDLNAYASYSRGVRSGGFNTGALFDPVEFSSVNPEQIDAFELGFKSQLLDRRVRLNAAAFYYDYNDMQVFGLFTGTNGLPAQRLQNADAEIYGAEVEVQARPVDGWDLNFAGAYTNATYNDFIDPIRGSFNGNRLDKTPRLQIAAGTAYRFDVSDDYEARIGLDFAYQSKMFFSPVNEAPMVTRAREEFNFNAGIANANGLDVSLFVRNIFNTRYLIDMNDLSALGFFFPVYNEPRTWGVTLSYEM